MSGGFNMFGYLEITSFSVYHSNNCITFNYCSVLTFHLAATSFCSFTAANVSCRCMYMNNVNGYCLQHDMWPLNTKSFIGLKR